MLEVPLLLFVDLLLLELLLVGFGLLLFSKFSITEAAAGEAEIFVRMRFYELECTFVDTYLNIDLPF